MNFLLGFPIFRGYVSFREGISSLIKTVKKKPPVLVTAASSSEVRKVYMVRPSTSNAVMRAACASKAPKPAADTMADSTDISSAFLGTANKELEFFAGCFWEAGGLSNRVCVESFHLFFFPVGLSC